jgi:hypothetical protein
MTVIGFLLLSGALWAVVGLIDFAQSRKRGPAVIQRLGGKILSSFWPSLVLHVGLFCLLYSAVAYVVIQMDAIDVVIGSDPMNVLSVALLYLVSGVGIAASLISIIRERTDDTWLLRRWLTRELRRSKDPEAHLETLLERIQSHPEEDSSKKALDVLRELSRKGDSTGGLVSKALEKHQLA